jgi:hypothetical protein
MLSGSLLLVLVPLLVFAVGIRKVVRERLVAQYDRRVELLVSMLDRDMTRQGAEPIPAGGAGVCRRT